MTVSRALRNAPGVSDATRKLVLNAAQSRGYRPDPSLAVLNAYRHGRRHLQPRATIAYLTNFATPDEWRNVGTFRQYFNGAQTRAEELGYTLEPFWLREPQLTDRRASQILVNRGIRGVIVAPLERTGSELQLDWDQFAAVALGRSLAVPALTSVAANHVQCVQLAWQNVWARGFRRIGLVLTEEEEARTAGNLHASHLLQQLRHDSEPIPVLIVPSYSVENVTGWMQRHRPDLIMTSDHRHDVSLIAGLAQIAHGAKLLHLNTNPRLELPGTDQQAEKVGEYAVTALHLRLLQRDLGVPACREITLIDSVWTEGRGHWRLPQRARPVPATR